MIIKHVKMRSAEKSSFGKLARYITDAQSKEHRLDAVNLTNCASLTVDDALVEIAATQAQNVRAKGDKTYHLIVSFRAGEQIDPATLSSIEQRICDGLGFAEHQRLSAVHADTDNLHMHIAINKIHPAKKTIHEPYFQHFKLGQLAEALEAQFGLEVDNHQVKRSGSESRAMDMEQHSGQQSLLGWIRANCIDGLKAAQSWDDFNAILAVNGLDLERRGNGFVFASVGTGYRVKASTVDRTLSAPNLETRFGARSASGDGRVVAQMPKYGKLPVRFGIDTTALYARFQMDRKRAAEGRKRATENSRKKFNDALDEVKAEGRRRRNAIKILGKGRDWKRLLYSQASASLKRNIEAVREDQRLDRVRRAAMPRTQTWADWLRAEAVVGNSDALAALRAREAKTALRGNTLQGSLATPHAQRHGDEFDGVTKKGAVIYPVAGSAVRDDGQRLQVDKSAKADGVKQALQMAVKRYGKTISVTGSIEFKARVILAAAELRLDIHFQDALLEKKRIQLINRESSNEHGNERLEHGRRNDRDGPGTSIGIVGRSTAPSEANGARASRPQPGATRIFRANVERIGTSPPPSRQHRLCSLSQLGVVSDFGRSELLLPSDVSQVMDSGETRRGADVRRRDTGSGPVAAARLLRKVVTNPPKEADLRTPAEIAADSYVAERENKRLIILDIKKHSRYNEGEGMLVYSGMRIVQGHTLALLERDGVVMVLPVDAKAVSRLKRVAVGTEMKMTSYGPIKAKTGRSR